MGPNPSLRKATTIAFPVPTCHTEGTSHGPTCHMAHAGDSAAGRRRGGPFEIRKQPPFSASRHANVSSSPKSLSHFLHIAAGSGGAAPPPAAMATVTPGVLLKLLQAMHTDDRVAGDHRSPVLQVTAVVPALTASTADSLWPSNGFLLQLSDGLHSTYVQLSPDDADALVSARPQLVGQLVHLDRLRFARPVPRAVGIRPVPSSGSVSFVGSPEPLVARPAACSRG
ncbi:hypothetical protein E2562_025169 [Oryza meyeriana var. granulata]|uniref:DUF936 domain-containing protein n=1 Tax=Oryza meyeriana var. granulata TaxID=110450 RepID=A0A6G1E1K2_9ORYZ|nr:hypothetical protein E2562_025169 [Oryza meyeriana var. granulata]